VLAGLTLPYSSGAVEGKVGKIKFLKRLMFGMWGVRSLHAL
jgi:transposase